MEHCEKLKFVCSSSIAKGLSQLQQLEIKECNIMQAIVVKEDGELEDRDMILFPQLRHLKLQCLPKLVSFLSTQNSIITDVGEIIHEGNLDFQEIPHTGMQPLFNEEVVLPNLETLELSSIHSEEILLHNLHRATSSFKLIDPIFQNLRDLKVKGSGNLKYLLSSSTATFMVQLKYLDIEDCKVMEEVLLTEDLGEEEIIPKELFPQLELMILNDLPVLKRFCVGSNIKFPSLKDMSIEKCPKLESFIFKPVSSEEISQTAMQPLFNEEVVFPNLETLELSSIHSEEILLHNQHRASSSFKLSNIQTDSRFHNLCNLIVKGSGNLKYLLSSSTVRFMVQLKSLYIEDCKVMEEILHIDEEEILSDALFPRLECLVLEDLPILKRFCIDSNVEFPSLKKFSIKNCPKLKTFAFRHASSNMEVRKGLVEINLEDNRHTTSQSHINESIVFANLESLEQSLIDLEEKQQNQHWARSFCKIKNMQTSIRFQNLSSLGVWGSDSFKYLLSSSIARSMVQVKYLHIVNCKAMEEILFIEEEEEEIIPKMLFPRLEFLKLNGLPILKRFCVGGNIEFKSMRSLFIEHCPKLKTFISKPSNSDTVMTVCKEIKEMNTEEIPRTVAIHPLFSEEVAFPSLEYLEISYVDDLKIIWDNQIPPYSLCKLQAMKVEFCENLMNIFQSDMLTRFRSLENLTITDCGSLQEVFQLQEQDAKETHDATVIPLKELRLDRVPKLKYVWNKDPQGIFNFPNLNLDSTGLRSYWSDSVPSD
ncbi:uncharacterized protein LOC142628530 [Castanea sativa]|uniref:uncharacterized protein LOC142628530 n=1 Tax=Castanea sativa TaxID=21020 RepID=UPI003F653B12